MMLWNDIYKFLNSLTKASDEDIRKIWDKPLKELRETFPEPGKWEYPKKIWKPFIEVHKPINYKVYN